MHRIYFLLLAISFCQWSFAKTFLIADRYLDVESMPILLPLEATHSPMSACLKT